MSESAQPDAAIRLWTAIEHARKDLAANRRELGKSFFELKILYSERADSAARRLSLGHGVFQAEIKKRGYQPNRVREWICDYEVEIGLRPPAESTAAKRAARRLNSARHPGPEDNPVSRFAVLLPFTALKTAYRTALQELHPDHGGSEERTKDLIRAWEAVEQMHCSVPDVEVRWAWSDISEVATQ